MKKILMYAALLSCTISGCKKVTKVSYAGVFRLEKQTISIGGRDTVDVRKQIKIYSDYHYMYAGMSPDSSVRFGVGTYQLDSVGKIDEHNIFNSRALDSAQVFVVNIKKNGNNRTQTIPELAVVNGVKYAMTEEYVKLPSAGTSSLDGVWELDKVFWVKGKDTLRQHEKQFKMFWGGHFMFIHNYPTNALGTQSKNGFGYGTFSLKGNVLTEDEQRSSHIALIGRKFRIEITFNGSDSYTQVATDPVTKEQTTEVYARLRQ